MKFITHLLKKGLVLSGLALFSYSTLIAQTTTNLTTTSDIENRIYYQVELNLIQGNDNMEESTAPALGFISGYRINEYLTTGIGIAWQNFDQMDIMPLFIHITGNLKASGHTPFIFADAGYGWAWVNEVPEWVELKDVDGGLALRSGLGYSFSGSGWNIAIHAGFMMQKSTITVTNSNGWFPNDEEIIEDRTRKRFTAGISFAF